MSALVRITTLLQGASTYALVDLATVHDELQIATSDTTNDAFLNRAISQVSAAISRYCNRSAAVADEASFPIEMVSDLFYPDRDPYPYQVPGGVQPLQLSHWPIAAFVQGNTTQDAPSGSSVFRLNSAVGVSVGMPVGGSYSLVQGVSSNAGPQNVAIGTVVSSVTNATVTLSHAVTEDVPAGTSLTIGSQTVTTQTDTPSGSTLNISSDAGLANGQSVSGAGIFAGSTVSSFADASIGLSLPLLGDVPVGTQVTIGLSVTQTDPPGTQALLVAGSDFQIDPPRGQLVRLDPFTSYPTMWMPLQYVVAYSGGFATIPDDVVDAALRWIVQRWGERTRDPSIRSVEEPGVGTTTYWVGGPKMSGGVPENIASLLDRYRVPVSA